MVYCFRWRSNCCYLLSYYSGGSKGGARDARPPLPRNVFIFMQFSGKIGQIIGWCPPFGVSAPSSGKSWIRHCIAFGTRTSSAVKASRWDYCEFGNCKIMLYTCHIDIEHLCHTPLMIRTSTPC